MCSQQLPMPLSGRTLRTIRSSACTTDHFPCPSNVRAAVSTPGVQAPLMSTHRQLKRCISGRGAPCQWSHTPDTTGAISVAVAMTTPTHYTPSPKAPAAPHRRYSHGAPLQPVRSRLDLRRHTRVPHAPSVPVRARLPLRRYLSACLSSAGGIPSSRTPPVTALSASAAPRLTAPARSTPGAIGKRAERRL